MLNSVKRRMEIKSLEFGPTRVMGHYYCHNNKLTTLKGSPTKVDNDFWCFSNRLTSLEYCPTHVVHLWCENNLVKLEKSSYLVCKKFTN